MDAGGGDPEALQHSGNMDGMLHPGGEDQPVLAVVPHLEGFQQGGMGHLVPVHCLLQLLEVVLALLDLDPLHVQLRAGRPRDQRAEVAFGQEPVEGLEGRHIDADVGEEPALLDQEALPHPVVCGGEPDHLEIGVDLLEAVDECLIHGIRLRRNQMAFVNQQEVNMAEGLHRLDSGGDPGVGDRAVGVPAPKPRGEDTRGGGRPDGQELLEVLLDELLDVGQLHDPLAGVALEGPLDETANDHRLTGTGRHRNDRVALSAFFEVVEDGLDRVVLVVAELHSIASP